MIVLKTCLANDGIFFAGEALTCTITFTNEETPAERQKSSSAAQDSHRSPSTQDLQSAGGNNVAGDTESKLEGGEVSVERDLRKMLSIDTFKAIANGIYNLSAGGATQPATVSTVSQSLPYTPATSEMVENVRKPSVLETIRAESNEILDIPNELEPDEPVLGANVYQEPMASEEGGVVHLSSTQTDRKLYPRRTDSDTNHIDDEPKQYHTNQLAARVKNSLPRISTSNVQQQPKGENISWAFVQIVGQFIVDSNYVDAKAFDSLRDRIMYQSPGSSGGFGGGGMLGSTSPTKTGSKNALPLFNTPPSILFIDENLAPGESRSCISAIN